MRWRPPVADTLSIGLLLLAPSLVIAIPAALGHPLMPGDDLIENFPLRVLVGDLLRHGELPTWNPYIWSGTPLLADFNSGAAYPLTWLFALLPAGAAWVVNELAVYWAAGIGLYLWCRSRRLHPVAAGLSAVSFAFAGAMAPQLVHLGLVIGMSWVPWLLLAFDGLVAASTGRSRLRWAAGLAVLAALIVLSGEPRAVTDAVVIALPYGGWRLVQAGRRRWAGVLWPVLLAVVLAMLLAAVQLLPGLEFLAHSQRSAQTFALFASGSLPAPWLLLLVVPELLGGSGSFGTPFFAPYLLTEVSGYVGLLPLSAGLIFLLRLVRRRPGWQDWGVWVVLAVLGCLLAVGGNSPLGPLLAHIPLYGGQRLQSRNILITDLALAVLFGYWVDELVRAGVRRAESWPVRLVSIAPMALSVGCLALAVTWRAGFVRWLELAPGAGRALGSMVPSLVASALLAVVLAAVVLGVTRLPRRRRIALLSTVVAIDLLGYLLMIVVDVSGRIPSTASTAPPGTTRPVSTAARHAPVAAPSGRFAIYDPKLIGQGLLNTLGQPDLNVLTGRPSVQGYTSLVGARYAGATGTHAADGQGQDTLAPAALAAGVFDQLGLDELFTLPAYFRRQASAGSTGPLPPPPPPVAAGGSASWLFGSPEPLARLTLPVGTGRRRGCLDVTLIRPDMSRVGLPGCRPVTDGSLTVTGHGQPILGLVVANPGRAALAVGTPELETTSGRRYLLAGPLQGTLPLTQWRYAGTRDGYLVFRRPLTHRGVWLDSLPGAPPGSLRGTRCTTATCDAATVSSPRGVTVVRSVAFAPGWSAVLHNQRTGRSTQVAVRRLGLIQQVRVPGGDYQVRWVYQPSSVTWGVRASLLGLLLTVGLLAGSGLRTRPRSSQPIPSRLPAGTGKVDS